MSHEDIEATKAPLMDHLIELRSRLIKALLAFGVMFGICFVFAKDIYNVLVWPFVWVAGPENSKFIYTALLEYFITQLKLAMFGAAFLSFPVVAAQIYMFVAPGLYRHERPARITQHCHCSGGDCHQRFTATREPRASLHPRLSQAEPGVGPAQHSSAQKSLKKGFLRIVPWPIRR